MPANLTPTYMAAEARFKAAVTNEEKLVALEEMMRQIPKHKGTEKMRAGIKTRISKTKAAIEQGRTSGKKGISFHVPKEGAVQCTLVGPPNSGKSSILASFTNAPATVADYPFTTIKPQPGMLYHENTPIQLVDLPAVSDDYMESWIPSLVRVSSICILVIGLDDISGADFIFKQLEDHKVKLVDSLEKADYYSRIVKLPTLIAATKSDHADAEISLELLKEEYSSFKFVQMSINDSESGARLASEIFQTLDLIRVYTQAPGKQPKMDQPIVVRKGADLLKVATEIHRDFASQLKYAKVWGSGKFDGQRVQRDYIVEDGDIIEFKI